MGGWKFCTFKSGVLKRQTGSLPLTTKAADTPIRERERDTPEYKESELVQQIPKLEFFTVKPSNGRLENINYLELNIWFSEEASRTMTDLLFHQHPYCQSQAHYKMNKV